MKNRHHRKAVNTLYRGTALLYIYNFHTNIKLNLYDMTVLHSYNNTTNYFCLLERLHYYAILTQLSLLKFYLDLWVSKKIIRVHNNIHIFTLQDHACFDDDCCVIHYYCLVVRSKLLTLMQLELYYEAHIFHLSHNEWPKRIVPHVQCRSTNNNNSNTEVLIVVVDVWKLNVTFCSCFCNN